MGPPISSLVAASTVRPYLKDTGPHLLVTPRAVCYAAPDRQQKASDPERPRLALYDCDLRNIPYERINRSDNTNLNSVGQNCDITSPPVCSGALDITGIGV